LNKALLDTDTYSEIVKAVDLNVTRNAIAYRQTQGILTISAVTVMEVIRGYQRNQSQRKLNSFLSAIAVEEVLDFDGPAAELAGRIAGDLERAGTPIGLSDPMIAAIALAHGLELVTGNTSHFENVRQLSATRSSWPTGGSDLAINENFRSFHGAGVIGGGTGKAGRLALPSRSTAWTAKNRSSLESPLTTASATSPRSSLRVQNGRCVGLQRTR